MAFGLTPMERPDAGEPRGVPHPLLSAAAMRLVRRQIAIQMAIQEVAVPAGAADGLLKEIRCGTPLRFGTRSPAR